MEDVAVASMALGGARVGVGVGVGVGVLAADVVALATFETGDTPAVLYERTR